MGLRRRPGVVPPDDGLSSPAQSGNSIPFGLPPWPPSPPRAWLDSPFLDPMALVPRWRYMTDEAKALTRRSAVSAGVVLVALLLFRGLLPWIVLGLVGWWIWKAISR